MKKIFFLGIAAMSVTMCARQESEYIQKAKKKMSWLVAKLELVSNDICGILSSKKDVQKDQKKELKSLAYSSLSSEPRIIDSCDHCKDLCTNDQPTEFV